MFCQMMIQSSRQILRPGVADGREGVRSEGKKGDSPGERGKNSPGFLGT